MDRRHNDPAERPDEDNPEWTQADFRRARPASEVLPRVIGARAAKELLQRKPGRPPDGERSKVSTTVRLDPDVLDAYKAEGKGWQTRINQTLRDHMPRRDK